MCCCLFVACHPCCRDLQAANKWLLAAAAGKLPQAQLLLGMAYKAGQWGCAPSPAKALSYIEKAA
jgi:TPR repeat protein